MSAQTHSPQFEQIMGLLPTVGVSNRSSGQVLAQRTGLVASSCKVESTNWRISVLNRTAISTNQGFNQSEIRAFD